jgi:6-phosphofructokinase 1
MSGEKALTTCPSGLDFRTSRLGLADRPSPLSNAVFLPTSAAVLYERDPAAVMAACRAGMSPPAMEQAGPRAQIFHDPTASRAAILTAGGLCPGLNDVIKGIVNTLWFGYGVKDILGIRYGYRGLIPGSPDPWPLDPDVVEEIHTQGGTILGSSRGPQDTGAMVDALQARGINLLFCIGGDGTLRGVHDLVGELARRQLPVGVIGIPKTIDNDIGFIDRTFGFETAVYATHPIIEAAHVEAKGAYNGLSLIHVMGRDSGFIAAHAALANTDANYCLIPEAPFHLDGPGGLLVHLGRRLQRKRHAVMIVAEGAGQHLFGESGQRRDASGNVLHHHIGEFLRDRFKAWAKAAGSELSLKYFDPTYLIRGVDAQGSDAIFCLLLAENAVHAAMAGGTDTVIGHWSDLFTQIPVPLAIRERKKIDLDGPLWRSLIALSGQPDFR